MPAWFALLVLAAAPDTTAPPTTRVFDGPDDAAYRDPEPAEESTEPPRDLETAVTDDAPVVPHGATTPQPAATTVTATEVDEVVAESSETTPEFGRTWVVGGFVDVAYLFNSNLPDNHLYRGTVTTPRTGEFTVNLATAYLTHAPVDDEPWRLELGLQVGAATDALYAAEPVPGGADGRFAGSEVWKHIALANAGGKIERTGTEIGAGLFASPIGIGGFWSRFNWNYSPSWESNAAPFYLAGARVLQDLPAGFGAQAWVVNGWQTVGDNNKAPSYLAGLTWDHSGQRGDWNAAQFVYFGPDDVDLSPRAWRVHSDSQVTWNGPRAGVGLVWDYGQERVTSLPEDPTHMWTGGGLFVHGLVHDGRKVDVDIAARPDAWFDRDGRIYGASTWLLSGTGTLNVTLFDHLLARAEYRFDHATADAGFFYRGAATSDENPSLAQDQHTVFVSLAGYFEHAFSIRRRPKA